MLSLVSWEINLGTHIESFAFHSTFIPSNIIWGTCQVLGLEKNRMQALSPYHTQNSALPLCLCTFYWGCVLQEERSVLLLFASWHPQQMDADCFVDTYYMKEDRNNTYGLRLLQNVQRSREGGHRPMIWFCFFSLIMFREAPVSSVSMWTRTTKLQAQKYLEQMM